MDVCLEYVQGLEQIAPNRNSFANHHVVRFLSEPSPGPTLLKLNKISKPTHENRGEFAVKLMWESYVMTADQLQKVRDGSALGRPLCDGPRRPSKCCTALQAKPRCLDHKCPQWTQPPLVEAILAGRGTGAHSAAERCRTIPSAPQTWLALLETDSIAALEHVRQ